VKPKWKALTIFVGVTASLIGGMFAWSRLDTVGFANALGFNQSAKLVGESMPAFSLRELRSGATVRSEELKGHVVVLAFWATWCPFCQQMLPALEKIHADPALRQSVAVYSIDVREDEVHGPGQRDAAVQTYMKDKPYTFPVLLGGPDTMGAFRVQAIPALIVVDGNGVIRYAGITEHSEQDIRDAIEKASSR